jgi:hypothetical protein
MRFKIFTVVKIHIAVSWAVHLSVLRRWLPTFFGWIYLYFLPRQDRCYMQRQVSVLSGRTDTPIALLWNPEVLQILSPSEILVSTNMCLEAIRTQKSASKRGNILQTPIFRSGSRCSLVSVVTLLWAGLTSNRGLAPKGHREIFSRYLCQHQLWDTLSFLSMGNGGYLLGGKVAEAWD